MRKLGEDAEEKQKKGILVQYVLNQALESTQLKK
jgi:hypothetical protein